MGLDVYLYHYINLDNSKKKKKLNLDGYGGDEKQQINLPSRLYPDHLFKIGYFRSSYNESGFNSVMENLGLPTLYDIFSNGANEYYVLPDWKQSKSRAKAAIEKMKKFLQTEMAKYRLTFIHSTNEINSRKEAWEIFKREIKLHEYNRTSYSNKNGTFFLRETLRVRGIIRGKEFSSFEGVYIIYDARKDDYLWYLHALEIVKETIDWVLNQKDISKYVLHWSG